MDHNPHKLKPLGQVIMDKKYPVTIKSFTPSFLYAEVYSGSEFDTWYVMTNRLKHITTTNPPSSVNGDEKE